MLSMNFPETIIYHKIKLILATVSDSRCALGPWTQSQVHSRTMDILIIYKAHKYFSMGLIEIPRETLIYGK